MAMQLPQLCQLGVLSLTQRRYGVHARTSYCLRSNDQIHVNANLHDTLDCEADKGYGLVLSTSVVGTGICK